MEELLEDYKNTLKSVIDKYSNYKEMPVSEFIGKYLERLGMNSYPVISG